MLIHIFFILFQHLARLEEVQKQRQRLHADKEALRLSLADREKQIDALRSQMEDSTQMAAQHRQSIDKLHQENNVLSNQLKQHRLETRQLEVSGAAGILDPLYILETLSNQTFVLLCFRLI